MPTASVIYRHTRTTRILHWINALSVFLVLMSGLTIFNAHPRLHLGQYGADADPSLLVMGAERADNGGLKGVVLLGSHMEITTTGLLGVSNNQYGHPMIRAFPRWATIPSTYNLGAAREWHFFFAWVLVINAAIFIAVSFVSRHVQRDLLPKRGELSFKHFLLEIWDHARLKFPRGEAARSYNLLQKLTYLFVIFVLGPLLLGTGLTMSPAFDAVAPWLLTLFDGRQTARTIHFFCAMLIILFIFIHLLMVVLAGPFNEIRSMITGRYALPAEKAK